MGLTTAQLASFRDPVEYQNVYLQRVLWGVQGEMAQSTATRRATSVKGCHASGKTYTAAGLIPWWLTWHDESLVIQISPTLRQVKTFWNEVDIACDQAKIKFPPRSTTGLEIAKNRYAVGFSSSKGVNIQGPHARHGLLITDETPGISADIWDAAEGMMAGGVWHRLSLGNPTVPSGPFYEDFTKNRKTVNGITISAFDSPNLAGVTLDELMAMNDDELGVSPWPFLTTRRWVRDFIAKWGVNHPKVRARVFGEFPAQADNACFQLAWIEKAKLEPDDHPPNSVAGVIQIGIDVAGPGDDNTVAVARIGGYILGCAGFSQADPRGDIARWCANVRKTYVNCKVVLLVDVVGIGYYFAAHLAGLGFEVYGFTAGAAARDSQNFVNAKAEAYWGLRERMQRGAVANLTSEEAQGELSDVLYRERADGRIEIESKVEVKARTGTSPDYAEAHILAFAPIVPRQQTQTMSPPEDISPF